MQKLIVFDLDGVLVESKKMHYETLNTALSELGSEYCISEADQATTYEGLPTKVKLALLSETRGLPQHTHSKVWERKQALTMEYFASLPSDPELIAIFSYLRQSGVHVAVASNSVRRTIELCLTRLGIADKVDLVLSNEDVRFPKPHPEIYWKAMAHFGVLPSDTAIFEDSLVGRTSAKNSGATLVPVEDRSEVTMQKVVEAVATISTINVLIPMAGAGSRFTEAGYDLPKPLIDVNGKPMIHAVVDNLGFKATYTYVVQADHYLAYNLEEVLNRITPGCNIVQVTGLTEGAAVTCLLAAEFVDNDAPLILANSDQIIEWSSQVFMHDMLSKQADGGIVVFNATHPKWSYAKADEYGLVSEVAEKNPISDLATVGVYYWKRGADFVRYARQMISKDIRTNGEFYTCPVFNEAIQDGKLVYTYKVDHMWGVGTPEDLQDYLWRTGAHNRA